MDQRGFYIKKCNKTDKLELFINYVQFAQYIKENGSNEWNKFVIYENENKEGKYSHNIKLINNKEKQHE